MRNIVIVTVPSLEFLDIKPKSRLPNQWGDGTNAADKTKSTPCAGCSSNIRYSVVTKYIPDGVGVAKKPTCQSARHSTKSTSKASASAKPTRQLARHAVDAAAAKLAHTKASVSNIRREAANHDGK